jgi:hypothetical protein
MFIAVGQRSVYFDAMRDVAQILDALRCGEPSAADELLSCGAWRVKSWRATRRVKRCKRQLGS